MTKSQMTGKSKCHKVKSKESNKLCNMNAWFEWVRLGLFWLDLACRGLAWLGLTWLGWARLG